MSLDKSFEILGDKSCGGTYTQVSACLSSSVWNLCISVWAQIGPSILVVCTMTRDTTWVMVHSRNWAQGLFLVKTLLCWLILLMAFCFFWVVTLHLLRVVVVELIWNAWTRMGPKLKLKQKSEIKDAVTAALFLLLVLLNLILVVVISIKSCCNWTVPSRQ